MHTHTHNLSSYCSPRECSDPLTAIQWGNCLELESIEGWQIDMNSRKNKQREGSAEHIYMPILRIVYL